MSVASTEILFLKKILYLKEIMKMWKTPLIVDN